MGWNEVQLEGVLMAKYLVIQHVEFTDSFEDSDIPEGMTAHEYAEARYVDSLGDLDSHTIELQDWETGLTMVEVDGTAVAFTRKVEL